MWHRYKPWVTGAFLAGIVAGCLYLVLPIQSKIRLGLDLQGGVSVLLQLNTSPEVPKITSQIQGQVQQVIDARINGLGVSEPQITTVGSDRLLVELPNVKNPDEAVRSLKEVAKLDFKIIPPAVNERALRDKKYANDPNGAYKDSGPIVYTGAELRSASSAPDQSGTGWQIEFTTKNPAKFGQLTQTNMGKLLGFFLDKKFISAATILGVITDNGQITGSFSEDDTIRIANDLNAGALPVPVTVIEDDTVGPILGKIDLQKSLYAAMAGLGLVLIFMLFVYRLPGLLADIALMVYVLMLLGLLAGVHAVLTLPGIAGFVLSVGMAVDANVLIFERLKEEIWAGKSLRASVAIGFKRALSAVVDSHVTIIVGAGVLFMLGTGTVKGFAYTLFWGTAFSLFTATFVTRYFVDLVVNNNLSENPKAYGA
ncbi:MAG: protein translocase subunit SecD [Candidatus Eremiobacteraeota bacterium]|nr:protein translocase subunit SecD [Candidatus Eremiobacteraeota bacterium]